MPQPQPQTSHNSAFAQAVPGLQLAWDSTSLGEAKHCLRKYYYSIILGYQPRKQSVHLTFGLLMHRGHETYHKCRAQGLPHDEALREALRVVLVESWDKTLGRAVEMNDSAKNRISLVRGLIWSLDGPDGQGDDSMTTRVLANGQAAAELSFRFASGYSSRLTGEPFVLCGHLDRVADFQGTTYIVDVKSTGHQLDQRWLAQFTPDNQFSLYVLAGKVVWHQPIEGLIVHGVQVGVSFSRDRKVLVPRPPPVIDEWYEDLGSWLATAEAAAERQHWPMNDKVCGLYGGCHFRPVCARPPGARAQWLEADYVKRVWDPLQAR